MIEVGQRIKLDGRTWTIVRVGKECRLESKGESIWRHSRTLESALAKRRPRAARAEVPS
jgi:hypothetical protein